MEDPRGAEGEGEGDDGQLGQHPADDAAVRPFALPHCQRALLPLPPSLSFYKLFMFMSRRRCRTRGR